MKICLLLSHLLDILLEMAGKNKSLSQEEVRYAIDMEKRENNSDSIRTYLDDVIVTTYQGKPLRPKTIGQKRNI